MTEIFKSKYLFFIICSLFVFNSAFAQFVIDAGSSQTVCPGDVIILGGTPTATGGKAPYKYKWSPSTGLSNDSIANPTASPTDFIIYTLTVTDDTLAMQSTSVTLTMSYIIFINAGLPLDFCLEGSGIIGGVNNVTGLGVSYAWAPSAGLNDSTLPQPTAKPILTTDYILTATIAGCPAKLDTVLVTVIQPPPINAGNDVTIKEGETTTLHATGGFFYEWTPAYLLLYDKTANPDAEPIITTTYYLFGTDAAKRCNASDTVTVFVEPSNDVVFYNTFTPNNDGNNDTWYIGNINKYPNNRLEIFNRNGKLVFKAAGYSNSWNGKSYLGDELAAATYFYMMDLGDGAGKFHGTVTIVK